ncbi:ABC transporter ATP-binding protein [Terasakiella brassicae]|uniref:ABC transporter ATP-binding protein n=1 Tax=Terasakiella brassicae TaxID=1634917 RepID=A0A917F7P5_9PROT|nr:ABC transporter ATP-binding protein [Terasakiella brassicae]GGF58288.1 ABC transporter ATP-binding protein [Terasakiella brassicae]
MKYLLETEKLSAGYGAMEVFWDLSLTFEAGRTTTIVGPNGAGKSTFLKTLMGLIEPRAGDIRFKGQSYVKEPTWNRINDGLVMIPEGRLLFSDLSVEENLIMGAYPKKTRKSMEKNRDHVFQLFPRLKERRNQEAGTLSGGEAQMLAIGRGLMEEPEICLVDEPSLGLSPVMTNEIFSIFRELKEDKMTIVLVEQNTNQALKIADHVYLMQAGKVTLSEPREAVDLQRLEDLYFARTA